MNAPDDDEIEQPTNGWTKFLIDLLCASHIPKLVEYNKYGKQQKEVLDFKHDYMS